MFDFLKDKLGTYLNRGKKQDKVSNVESGELKNLVLSRDVEDNISRLKEVMNNSYDIKVKRIKLGPDSIPAAVMFIDNLINEDVILEYIIRPLSKSAFMIDKAFFKSAGLEDVKQSLVSAADVQEVHSFDKIVLGILTGSTFIMLEGHKKGLIADTAGFVGRTAEEPKVENSVKGPKEGFVENLRDNLGMIRKRLRDPNLTFDQYKIGRRSKANIIVAYIKGVVDQDIVTEVDKRIKAIDVDDGVVAAQVNHLLSDSPNSIFPLVQVTERPDKTVSSLLDGRVAVIMEGTPDILLVPVSLPILMQSVDDYYEKWILGSIIRVGRYIALFASMLLPALYIALTSFHPSIMPTNIALSIAGTRVGVPFPAFLEAFLMTSVLELLTEAGIRLPRVVGQTVSIVGGLVIGQAAVQAGVISPVMVIVISITAISSFVIPDYSLGLATRIMRIPFMFSASIFGTVGTSILLLSLLGYVAALESYGVGYLEPITPYRPRDWKDTLIRGPVRVFGKRPEFLTPEDTQRQRIHKGGKQDADK